MLRIYCYNDNLLQNKSYSVHHSLKDETLNYISYLFIKELISQKLKIVPKKYIVGRLHLHQVTNLVWV